MSQIYTSVRPMVGGFWERLRKILGRASLNEKMSMILCDCETVSNSKPLTYVYDAVDDLSPVTPNIFLQEIKEMGFPKVGHIRKKDINITKDL